MESGGVSTKNLGSKLPGSAADDLQHGQAWPLLAWHPLCLCSQSLFLRVLALPEQEQVTVTMATSGRPQPLVKTPTTTTERSGCRPAPCAVRRPAGPSRSWFAGGGGRGTSTTSPPGGAECAGTRSKVAVHYRAGRPPSRTTTAAVSGSAGCGDRRHCRHSSPVAGCSASAPGPQSLRSWM